VKRAPRKSAGGTTAAKHRARERSEKCGKAERRTGAEPEAGTGGKPPNRAGPHRPDRDRKPEHSAGSGESPPRDGAEVGQRKAGAGCKNPAAARRFPFKIFSPRSVRKKSYALFSVPQKPRGQGSNDRKSPFSSLSDGNFTVRNADFSRSDQHADGIRHRRTGAPDFLRDFRISHELRRISYPFPEVFIYSLRRRFQIVIFSHFRALSFALPRFSPFPVCFSYPCFIAPLRLYFCPFRGTLFFWWQVLFSVALPADL